MMMRLVGAAAIALLLFSPACAGEAIHGVWVRGGHPTEKLEFYDCDGKLCARETMPQANGAPAEIIIRHAAKTAPNEWKGDLFNPENGKIYGGTVTLDKPNQFTLTGCLMSVLCQSETWTRDAKAAPQSAKPAPQKAKPATGSPKAGGVAKPAATTPDAPADPQ